MLGLLIVPMLICGYFYIIAWPTERIRISLYHGYSLYIRAAAFGFLIVAFIFFSFGVFFPWLGVWFGQLTGYTPLPDTNIFKCLSLFIKGNNALSITDTNEVNASFDIASISIVSIFMTWIVTVFISVISKGKSDRLKRLSRLIGLEKVKKNSIEKLFLAKSPVEYHLLIIAKKAEEDLSYNDYMRSIRKSVFEAIVSREIDRKNKLEMQEIFATLEYREVNYALITLENDKFYIGLPTILPEPDEEGVASTSIQIIPVISGYRDERKLLSFTTEYDFDLSGGSSHDCISFPRDKILSVSGFSFDTYERLKRKLESKDKADD